MLNKFAAGALLGLLGATGAAAQQPARPPVKITIGVLLNAGFDLKTVLQTRAPCGNQPSNQAQMCTRELYFLQSPQKNLVYRCELGPWNGIPVVDCTTVP